MAEPTDRDPLRLGRRNVLRGLLLGGVGLTAVTACGVPSGTKPHVVGRGPSSGPSGNQVAKDPPSPLGIVAPKQFVEAFLTASAGKQDTDSLPAVLDNVRRFLTPAAAAAWQPGPSITVIRVINIGTPAQAGSASTITLDYVPVGQLTASGSVAPGPSGAQSVQLTLVPNDVNPGSGPSWHIDTLPTPLASSLVLSSDGLENYYQAHLIYFWDNGKEPNNFLVPDLRYVPLVGLQQEAQPTEIVNGLLAGPADLLGSGLTPLPSGAALQPRNVVKADGAWVVDFTALQGAEPVKIAAQVQLSLQPQFTEPIQLKIAGQPKPVDTTPLRSRNLADDASRTRGSEGYFIVDGRVRETAFPHPVPPVFAPINDPTLHSASLSRDLQFGAVVRADNQGRYRLSVGRRGSDGGEPSYVDVTGLPNGPMCRPVWLPGTQARLLIVASNALYSVNLAGQVSPITVDIDANPNQVSAFAVGPDGRRIALISGGQVYLSVLSSPADNPTLGSPRRIDSGGFTELTAVAWSRVNRLALAGKPRGEAKYGLTEVSVDGAVKGELYSLLFNSRVTQLVGNPPTTGSALTEPGPVMVQTLTSGSSRVVGLSASPLKYTPAATASPNPTGTASAPTSPSAPINPFYVD